MHKIFIENSDNTKNTLYFIKDTEGKKVSLDSDSVINTYLVDCKNKCDQIIKTIETIKL